MPTTNDPFISDKCFLIWDLGSVSLLEPLLVDNGGSSPVESPKATKEWGCDKIMGASNNIYNGYLLSLYGRGDCRTINSN